MHFAEDGGGFAGSLLVHAAVFGMGMAVGVDHAFKLMLTYLATLACAQHYGRHICMARWRLAVRSRGNRSGTVRASSVSRSAMSLSDGIQRIILAHVLFERSLHG